jgi:hypothetical protein
MKQVVRDTLICVEQWSADAQDVMRWAIACLWYGFIYILSDLPAASSQHTAELVGGVALLNMLLRMVAHALVFGVLAAILYLALCRNFKLRYYYVWFALVLTGILGFLDELHQSFVPGRYFRVQDVLTDVVGGALMLWVLFRLRA